jgi:fucose 4-O-acetylase-like acetyltransferase
MTISSSSTHGDPPMLVTQSDSTTRRREVWADVAKGVCILLVVLWHVVEKHYLEVTWRISLPIPGVWGTFVEQMLPLRMPLFFTISGIFAATAVSRPWSVVRRPKVARLYYLYIIWVLIHTAVLSLTPDLDTAHATNALELLEELTITPPNLWYLYALALYFVIAKTVRRAPPAVVLAAAFVLSAVAAAGFVATPGNRGGLYQNLFFFLAGGYFRPFVEGLARRSNLPRLALTGTAYAVALFAMAATASQEWPLVWPLVSVVAVLFGVTAAGQVARWPVLGGALAFLGRRTLPIYVVHMPVLALLDLPLYGPLSTVDVRWQWVFAVVEPAVLTALVVAICLTLETLLRKVGASWLFELPGRRTRRATPPRHAAPGQGLPPPADPIADSPTVPLPYLPRASRNRAADAR